MPKRSNPFIEDFVPQSKVYVNLKQFNNNEDRLQKVYEKTLELLYKGANKSQPKDNDEVSSNYQRKPDGKKQLFIGNDGSLLHSGFLLSEIEIEDKCTCGNLKTEYCAYCECILCTTCQHHCLHCQQYYCSKCSLTGFDNSEICVSCYH